MTISNKTKPFLLSSDKNVYTDECCIGIYDTKENIGIYNKVFGHVSYEYINDIITTENNPINIQDELPRKYTLSSHTIDILSPFGEIDFKSLIYVLSVLDVEHMPEDEIIDHIGICFVYDDNVFTWVSKERIDFLKIMGKAFKLRSKYIQLIQKS